VVIFGIEKNDKTLYLIDYIRPRNKTMQFQISVLVQNKKIQALLIFRRYPPHYDLSCNLVSLRVDACA